MTDSKPSEIHLADYMPPPYVTDAIDLAFYLGEDFTTVRSRLTIRRQKGTPEGAALTLDGQGLKLESVRMDGQALDDPTYAVTPDSLIIDNPPATFVLDIETRIEPQNNTALEGLYKSSGNFVTQCEAEGFRRITYYPDRPDIMAVFTVSIEAEKADWPIMLSNGNLEQKGQLENGRHWVSWHDPHPKPSYLFALVAGDLHIQKDSFVTTSGRKVALEIYVDVENSHKCDHALRIP